MSQTYAAPVIDEFTPIGFQHELLTALDGKTLQPEIESLWSVGSIKPGEEDSGYILAVVSHYTDPLQEIDVADAERVETLICGCPGFYYHAYDPQVGAKVADCKHCTEVKRKRRTEVDEHQERLVKSE